MDAQLLAEFKSIARSLFDSNERQFLQKTISSYKDDEDFERLIESLKTIIISSEQCHILPFIRLFLLRKHRNLARRLSESEFLTAEEEEHQRDGTKVIERMSGLRREYSSGSSVSSNKKRHLLSAVINRKMHESLGIGIRGGIDFGCGIFVSDVQPDSPAAKAGLQVGDQIIFVNNISFESITANAAARFLASAFPAANATNSSRLRIVFSRTGMVPAHRTNRERMAWNDVRSGTTVFGPFLTNGDSQSTHYPPLPAHVEATGGLQEFIVNVHVTLSFAIRGGRDFGLGIYIAAVGNKESDADQLKGLDLKVGDEIVAVNGKDIQVLRHSQAVDFLRQQKHLALTVKHVGKYPLFKEISSEVTWIAANPDQNAPAPTSATQSVRTELPWETVVTVRRNSHLTPSINQNNTDYTSLRPLQQSSQRSLSFSLTKSSSGSLVIDAANVQQHPRHLHNTGGSLRSSWTASASGGSGNGSIVSQPAKESFVFHSTRRRIAQPARTPISTIHFDEVNNSTTYCDAADFKLFQKDDILNGGLPRQSLSSFESVNARISRQCSSNNYEHVTFSGEQKQEIGLPPHPRVAQRTSMKNGNDYDIKPRSVAFTEGTQVNDVSNLEPVRSLDSSWANSTTEMGFNTGAALRPPSVAVKGKHTTLVKLPKRPDTSLGLGVSGGGDSPDQCLRIDHALPDSIAGEAVADGLLQPGCLLLAVDGQSLVGATHEDAVSLIRRCFRDASKPSLNLLISTSG